MLLFKLDLFQAIFKETLNLQQTRKIRIQFQNFLRYVENLKQSTHLHHRCFRTLLTSTMELFGVSDIFFSYLTSTDKSQTIAQAVWWCQGKYSESTHPNMPKTKAIFGKYSLPFLIFINFLLKKELHSANLTVTTVTKRNHSIYQMVWT